jgi:4-hydroxy-tetrahydrodipicolinate synthase
MAWERNLVEGDRLLLSGVICAALTPIDATLEPDGPAAAAYCARLLERGCDGINLLGTTGEATSLSVRQRMAVMSAVAEAGLPLQRFMVGTGAAALADAVALTAHATHLGFAGALVIPPFYFKPVTDDGVSAYYAELVRRVADPRLRLYFYNFPQLSGITISPAVIARVGERCPGVPAGLKDSSGDRAYALDLAQRFPELAIFPSSEAGLDTARADGYAGCISATLNLTAPLAARVWSGGSDADVRDLRAMRETIARYPLVPALRAFAAEIFGDEGWARPLPPLSALAAEARAELDAALRVIPAYGALRERLAA